MARYSRHILLPEMGLEGQRRLKTSRVLLVGMGGLGSPVALYLVAAGVGSLVLIDFDRVDESNLQRQVLFDTRDIGRAKVEAARSRLIAQNPHVSLETVNAALDASNARDLVAGVDLVIDGADNFATRYLVNDACVLVGRPNVFGSVARFEGQISVFVAADGPCYRCLHPEPPPDGLIPSCAEGGVLGVVPGVVGAIQATEAVKLLARIGEPLIGRLLLYDALRMRAREIVLPRDPECPVCGESPRITELQAADLPPCLTSEATPSDLSVDAYATWRRDGRLHLLIDVREPSEHASDRIEGSRLIPLGVLASHMASLPGDRPVVVHCRTGQRSARAVAQLRARGIDARNLVGGLQAWREMALETPR